MRNLKKAIVVFLSMFVVFTCTYCGKIEESQIKIGVLYCAPNADIASELTDEREQSYIHIFEQSLDITEKRVNAYLEKIEKKYRVSYELIVPYQDEIIDYEEYDIIKGDNSFDLDELEELFLNLNDELAGGKLAKVYESMPEKYWDTVKVNGKIYNLNRTGDPIVHVLKISQSLLDEYGLTIPENLIGEPLCEWKPFFQTVYEKNENAPFLPCPFDGSYDLGPFLPGNVWNAHFQLLTPFLGIAYDEPEKGVQCIYESSYAKKMNETWGEYQKAGYVVYEGYVDELVKDIPSTKMWDIVNAFANSCVISCAGVDLGIKTCVPGEYLADNIDRLTIALQNEIYNSPEPIGMTNINQMLVTKKAEKKKCVFAFLTDMHTDAELMKEVNQTVQGLKDIDGNEVSYTTSLSAAASALDGVREQYRSLYGSEQEKRATILARLENLSSVPAADFVVDTRKIETSIDEMVKFLEKENLRLKRSYKAQTSWIDVKDEIEKVVDELYDMGLQEIIDEVNRQLEEYRKG